MVSKLDIIRIQNTLVQIFVTKITVGWDFAFLSYEWEGDYKGWEVTNSLALVFRKIDSGWARESISPRTGETTFPDEMHELAVGMAGKDGQLWKSFILEVDKTGKYRFEFSYDPPRRIHSGELTERDFVDYVPRPL